MFEDDTLFIPIGLFCVDAAAAGSGGGGGAAAVTFPLNIFPSNLVTCIGELDIIGDTFWRTLLNLYH